MPAWASISISACSTAGSATTPLPMMQTVRGWKMPEGIRRILNVPASFTIVWPALAPPLARTTTRACSASRSTTLPLPSSPHWQPTMAITDMSGLLTSKT